MRVLKFRAYDGMDWIYSSTIEYVEEFKQWMILDSKKDEWMYCGEPGQYTGLKDKNGREVYEGDVVTDDHNYYLVEFKHGMFKPICYAMLDEKGLATGYEIIGNIYENPELLGDDK